MSLEEQVACTDGKCILVTRPWAIPNEMPVSLSDRTWSPSWLGLADAGRWVGMLIYLLRISRSSAHLGNNTLPCPCCLLQDSYSSSVILSFL